MTGKVRIREALFVKKETNSNVSAEPDVLDQIRFSIKRN